MRPWRPWTRAVRARIRVGRVADSIAAYKVLAAPKEEPSVPVLDRAPTQLRVVDLHHCSCRDFIKYGHLLRANAASPMRVASLSMGFSEAVDGVQGISRGLQDHVEVTMSSKASS
jgi:hypothetical protein